MGSMFAGTTASDAAFQQVDSFSETVSSLQEWFQGQCWLLYSPHLSAAWPARPLSEALDPHGTRSLQYALPINGNRASEGRVDRESGLGMSRS